MTCVGLWLHYWTVSFCAEQGNDLAGWGKLFAKAGDNGKIAIYFYQTAERRPTYFAFVRLKLAATTHLCLEYGDTIGRRQPPDDQDLPWFTFYGESGFQHLTAKIIGMPTLLAFARSVVRQPPPS